MKCEKLGKLGLKGLLLLENSGLVGHNSTHVSAKSLYVLCKEDSVLLVSSQNASKQSVRASTGSSKSGGGLHGVAAEVGCGGGGGG